MERWRDGVMGKNRSNGGMEQWSDAKKPITPILQYSSTPICLTPILHYSITPIFFTPVLHS
jgi:hypothetical protein